LSLNFDLVVEFDLDYFDIEGYLLFLSNDLIF
jgi:hypothetical protein